MTNSNDNNKGKKFTFNLDRSSHFDLCCYCLNCNKCVSEHWKKCRMRLDRKQLSEDTKKKISEAKKGKSRSEETKK